MNAALPAEPFVLERVENPHPEMLADAQLVRANAIAATERLGELRDCDLDWRQAWKFYRRAMAKATGCSEADIDAWVERRG